jgi:hypothetical protein
MSPAASAAEIVVVASVPSEQSRSSHRAAATSVPSSYAVWEKER